MSATDTTLADADFARGPRLITIDSALGGDRLLAVSLIGSEAISEPFRYDLDLLSSDTAIAPERLVGTAVTLRLMPAEAAEHRLIHGMVSRLAAGPLAGRGFRSYRVEVIPWLWFLSRSSDCRIFQNLAVPDIVERVFQDHGFADFEIKVDRAAYPKLDYCVQYRETTLDFISRLMDQAGIFYFFRHEQRRHLLVVADSNAAFRELPPPENRPRYTEGAQQAGQIRAWEHAWQFRPGRWAQKDYDFERPSDALLASEPTVLKFPRADAFERFDYPGGYVDLQRGRKKTRLLMEAEEAAHHAVHGAGSCASFVPGGRFALEVHPIEGEAGKPYVLRRVRHEAREPSYFAGMEGGVAGYANTFECFPADQAFRPERTARKPVVQGPQTATVTGPAGEEIHTDKHGRVKLRFHWDRNPDGNADENSSCWVRVSQAWAGAGFGAIQIPRIGQEVVVDFLEGDPDQPLVTGRVYNGANPVPYGLPDAATQSGIKSNSSKGGGGSNELRMEDSKGSEQVYFHAQKDLDSVVENNETRHVKVNRDTAIDANETVTVGANRTETVHANETIHIVGNRAESVDQNETVAIALTRTHAIGIADTLTVGAARTHTVGAAETIAVGASRSVRVGRAQTIDVGADQQVTVGKDQTVSVGKNETRSVGKTLTVSAGDEIVLKTGSASITMKKNGDIVIDGKQITIKGTGDVIVKGKNILQN
jgi:type VI secretion system secreted protein VgrG